MLASAGAEQRRQQLVGVADLGDVLVAGAVERRRRHHEDRGVDEEREHQRDGGIDRREADRLAPALQRVAVLARLHDRGVQVEVVRHHRRAEDADRDVEHVRVAQDLGVRDEARQRRRRESGCASHSSIANEPAIARISATTSAST